MLEKALNLFERFVIAVEEIARSMGTVEYSGSEDPIVPGSTGIIIDTEPVINGGNEDSDSDNAALGGEEKAEGGSDQDNGWLYDQDAIQQRYQMVEKKDAIDAELVRLGIIVPKSWPYPKRHQAICDFADGKAYLKKYMNEDSAPDQSTEAPEGDFDLFDEAPDEAPAITMEDVKAAAMAFVKANGADGKKMAYALIQKVGGVQKLKELPEDKYAAFVEACNG